MYIIEPPIWKGEIGVLVWVESLRTFFDEFTRGLSNFFETESLMTSSSASGVNSIDFNVLGSYLAHMDSKEKLDV